MAARESRLPHDLPLLPGLRWQGKLRVTALAWKDYSQGLWLVKRACPFDAFGSDKLDE